GGQGPHRVLARGAAPEILVRHQDARGTEGRLVEDEIRALGAVLVEPHVVEEQGGELGSPWLVQEARGNDPVGVDVDEVEGHRHRGEDGEGVHPHAPSRERAPAWGSRRVTAAAAAMAGLIRCVRPPLPCRPSKFRLEVDATRSPLARISGFMPRHIEHPALRHSKPAAVKIRSSPSRSAWAFTCIDPGTTRAQTWEATRCPLTMRLASRRSSILALVQLPMNTRSMRSPSSGVPGSRPM